LRSELVRRVHRAKVLPVIGNLQDGLMETEFRSKESGARSKESGARSQEQGARISEFQRSCRSSEVAESEMLAVCRRILRRDPTLQRSNTPILQYSNTPTLQCSNTPGLLSPDSFLEQFQLRLRFRRLFAETNAQAKEPDTQLLALEAQAEKLEETLDSQRQPGPFHGCPGEISESDL
jgi:hypothetical protein